MYFPTQDGASHIYNSYVLKEYHKHENYRLREVYKLNLTLFPNWTSHILMASLMYVFPPIICEKILLTLCIGLLPLSLFYFLRGVEEASPLFGLVGFIYAYNYLLHMGFYNFVLSMSLFFFALGYWWRHRSKPSTTSIVVMYVLLLVTYLTHFHSYSLLIISLTFFAIFSSVYDTLHKTWGYKEISTANDKTLVNRLKVIATTLKPTLIFLGSMLPAYFIMFAYYLTKRGKGGNHKGFEWLKDYFLSMKSLVAFRDDHILIGRVLLVVFAIAFLLTVIDRVRQIYDWRRSKELERPGERLWTSIVTRRDGFLLMAGAITGMYFIFPWSSYGGGWINDRFHIYIFLVLLPFFSVNLHRYVSYATAGIIIALSLWHLGYNVQTYYLLNRDIADAISSAGMYEEHTILTSQPGEWGGLSDSLGMKPKYVEPFGHVECLLAVKNGVAYLKNYEAETDHFPLKYKTRNMPADYVLVWRTEYDSVGHLAQDYELIHSNNHNRLYRRKKSKPDEQLWGGVTTIAFDMQPHNGQIAPGHIAVYNDTAYTDGRYGWLTRSERGQFESESEVPEPYKDSIWGEEDGVFRVTLPNGEYRITCYFHSGAAQPLEINLIANGEKKIKKLRIPTGNETIELSYDVTITDERLTQVIYTRARGAYKRWGWSGCTVERRK